MELRPWALGLSFGILWGIGMFLTALVATAGIAVNWVVLFEDVYIGYQPGLIGGIIGFFYGFVDAFIGGFLIAWLYNLLSKERPRK